MNFTVIDSCKLSIFGIFSICIIYISWRTCKLASQLSVPPCKIKSFIHSIKKVFAAHVIPFGRINLLEEHARQAQTGKAQIRP